jgi:tuftelin-interacting protein 11
LLLNYVHLLEKLSDLSEASSASHIASLKSAASHLMELRYNVRMLVSESETELVRLTRALSVEKQTAVRAAEDEVIMKTRLDSQIQKRERLSAVLELAKKISEIGSKLYCNTSAQSVTSFKKPALTIDMVDSAFSEFFQMIQDSFFAEYAVYGLDLVIIASLSPLIKRLLIGWDPLRDPKFGIELFQKWRWILRRGAVNVKKASQKDHARSMSAFETMMYEIWLPKVRQVVK